MKPMKVTIRKADDVTVIEVRGWYDSDRGDTVQPTIRELLDAGVRKLLLHLAKAGFATDGATGDMMAGIVRAVKAGVDVRVCGSKSLPPPLALTLELYRLKVYPSEAKALRDF